MYLSLMKLDNPDPVPFAHIESVGAGKPKMGTVQS